MKVKAILSLSVIIVHSINSGCHMNLNPFEQEKSKHSETETEVLLFVEQMLDISIHYDEYSLKLLGAIIYERSYSQMIPLPQMPINRSPIHKNIRIRLLDKLGKILEERNYFAEYGDYSYTFTLPEGFYILEIFDDNTGMFMQYTRPEMETL